MKEQGAAERLRKDFKQFDDSVLLTVADVAALSGSTETAVYAMKARGQLPRPVIEQHRRIRWTAGQIRTWIASLEVQAGSPTSLAPTRRGRRRAPTDSLVS